MAGGVVQDDRMRMNFPGLRQVTRIAALIAVTGLLFACADGQGANPPAKTVAAPAPDYLTSADHFASLQRAGLGADYQAFARHLKPADAKLVTDALQRSFRGGPFDVYTRKSVETDAGYKRLVELRSTSGRLYLYVELDRVTGGWVVSGYDIDRKRDAVMARL